MSFYMYTFFLFRKKVQFSVIFASMMFIIIDTAIAQSLKIRIFTEYNQRSDGIFGNFCVVWSLNWSVIFSPSDSKNFLTVSSLLNLRFRFLGSSSRISLIFLFTICVSILLICSDVVFSSTQRYIVDSSFRTLTKITINLWLFARNNRKR